MITNKKGESKTLSPKTLGEILADTCSNVVYVIEDVLQREFVWGRYCIETLWDDILSCVKTNIEHGKAGGRNSKYNSAYLQIGNLEHSVIDKCNEEKLYKLGHYDFRSIVDGSQRIRSALFLILAFMYEIAKEKNEEYIDMSYIEYPDGNYKLIEAGIGKLDAFYHKVKNTKVLDIEKDLTKSLRKSKNVDNYIKGFDNEDEKDYYDIFILFISLIERDVIGVYSLKDTLDIILDNTVLYEEEIPEENKFDRFLDRNKKGTPMSDESMYPKYIINKFDSSVKNEILDSFLEFKKTADEIQIKKGKPGQFRATKNGDEACIYIMIEALKIMLGMEYRSDPKVKKMVFSSTFNLSNMDYGVAECFKREIFKTYNDAIEFFKLCNTIALFVKNDSFIRHRDFFEDCYNFRDFATPDVEWWYFIKPTFIACWLLKENRYKDFVFAKKMLSRLYYVYILSRSCSTNSQNLINKLENISYEMLSDSGENFIGKMTTCYNDFLFNLREKDDNSVEETIKRMVNNLSYGIKTHRKAIDAVLTSLEQWVIEETGISTENFYYIWKKNGKDKNAQPSFDKDHWVPKNKFSDLEDNSEYERIGNIVLLENSLNRSKQDDEELNSKYYGESGLIQTKYMNKDIRGTFNSNILEKLNKMPFLVRYSEDTLKHPSKSVIEDRKNVISDSFTKFIVGFTDDNKNNEVNVSNDETVN